ncbi:hypothetical protein Q4Q34_15740 [Flavivirga abyssicola]|uniref:hypothetical protein n=1 Tax=Flavivirga abyssicola TaxID=3063533 RepID=UPI0026DFEFEE|nr:hypothetical protein [Flavivirga sp. MEBiC07777]WVK12669.1 hypothetical protein Q4Q34_15740 [Flavivirga sp. MEBiC07777]
MKKLLFVLYCFPILSFAQTVYYDAIELSKLNPKTVGNKIFFPVIGDNNKAAAEILIKYTGGSNYNQVQAALATNAFISLPADNSVSGRVAITPNSNILGSVGNLNVNTIADSVVKFLIDRAKEELTVAFFDRFQEVFNGYPEFQLLFPETHENFKIIETFNFNRYLNSLQEGFLQDLKELHINLIKLDQVTCQPKNKKCTKRVTFYNNFFTNDGGRLLKTGLTLIEELKEGTNPAEILTHITKNSEFNKLSDPSFTNVKNLMKFTDLISNSFRSATDNVTWVSNNDIINMISNPVTFKIYLGLLYQLDSSNPINFETSNGTKSLQNILGNLAQNVAPIENYLRKVVNDIDQIRIAWDHLKSFEGSDHIPEGIDYYAFYQSIISLLGDISELNPVLKPLNSSIIKHKIEIEKFLQLANRAGNIYRDLSTKNYSTLIVDLRFLLEDMRVKNSPFLEEFLKYGSFMVGIAQAKDSDEVHQIIESIALPSGSSIIKKRSKFNVSLNSYVGISPSLEYNGDTKDSKFSLGVNVPIGVATSWGAKKGGSFSLFFPLIDLGAVTNFRFSDEKTEELPEIKLENIFAPGFYVVHGWARLPISWGVGGQLGPQLREVNPMDIVVDADTSFSFKAFIAVDIPLLNFYTKSR